MWKKLVYGLIGLAGVGSLLWVLFNWSQFWAMSWWLIVVIILLIIGGINWGVKALWGRDLLGYLGDF